jgi:hypothetical protein
MAPKKSKNLFSSGLVKTPTLLTQYVTKEAKPNHRAPRNRPIGFVSDPDILNVISYFPNANAEKIVVRSV